MRTRFITFTEEGPRLENEDFFRVVMDKEHSAFILCDGMGGHTHGQEAAQTVGETICKYWLENSNERDSRQKALNACESASDAIDNLSEKHFGQDMGTTLELASIEGTQLTVVNIGDSRCYVARNGSVIFQTTDHVHQVYGRMSLSKCFFVGRRDVAVPDVVQMPLQPGDRIMLCSDGVYNSTSPDTLCSLLSDVNDTLDNLADAIKFLCEKNAKDNYTAIFVEVLSD